MTKERIEQRMFRLRLDDRFNDQLTETLARDPEVNRLVLTGKVSVDELREFALRAIECAFVREDDGAHDVETRYDAHVKLLVEEVGEYLDVAAAQRDAFRSIFRFVHAAFVARMDRPAAWRAFALAAPKVRSALVELHSQLREIINGRNLA